ncbi:MAG TPA: iron-sulfur cluster assembly scaffold protein [Elusimicrobiota bacterium]|nr:iron-sulfur cluster assembly scaffold protein [Elusimicrobiota bacterium]
MYTPQVLDHFQNPRNVGEMADANAVGESGSAVCGDVMRIFLRIEGGVVQKASFKTFGCGAAIATSSVLTELVKGKTIDEVRKIKNTDVVAMLGGLPPIKIHCSVLAEETLKAALDDYERRTPSGTGK